MAASIIKSSPIGYYVHHHGIGHMQRAIAICKYITRPVVMFSAQPQPANLPPQVTFVQLALDVVNGYQQPEGSFFHYTPYAPAIFQRNQQLIDAWHSHVITEMYVDVSIEVATLAKLYGLTVGHALMTGVRTDEAHSYGYAVVDYVLAHCAPDFDNLNNHSTHTPVLYSGGIARYKKQLPEKFTSKMLRATKGMPPVITVTISPKSEHPMVSKILQNATYFPDITWHIVGQAVQTALPNVVAHGVIEDPGTIYQKSDVIIGSGGTNTIMEVACFGKPFICIPESRPFDEQLTSAQTLERLGAAVYLPAFPEPNDWPNIINKALQLDLTVFSSLVSDIAAARAAQIIETAGIL